MVCWPCWRSMGANRKAAWSVVVVVALWLGGCDTAAEITAQSVALPTAISPAATPAPAAEAAVPARPTSTAIPATLVLATPVTLPVTPTSEATPEPVITEATEAAIQSLVTLSAGGRPINSYRLGDGATAVVVVGGIHGGYEWNSILLVERLLAHYESHPGQIPAVVTLHIIPNANPDGLFAVTGSDGPFTAADFPTADPTAYLLGRFNANGVDLNRNWDCNWTTDALWRNQAVPGGSSPFSEPETRGLRDFLQAIDPAIVIFYHSAANAVYVSGCPLPHAASRDLALVYGLAAGYAVEEVFDHYVITGDAGDWLTTQGIASFTVELASHESLDWKQNLAGLQTLLSHFVDN